MQISYKLSKVKQAGSEPAIPVRAIFATGKSAMFIIERYFK
jgi:hypothetical protein